MFVKFLVIAGFITVCLSQQAPQQRFEQEYGEIPRYSFSYSVDEPQTGDNKAQEEVREGDNVRGFYTVVDADGALRRVDYTADEENGFRATVSRQPGAASPAPVKPPVPIVRAQPIVRPVTQEVVAQPILTQRVITAQPVVLRTQPIIRTQTISAPRPRPPTPVRVESVRPVVSTPVETIPVFNNFVRGPSPLISSYPVNVVSSPISNVPVQYISSIPQTRVISSPQIFSLPESQFISGGSGEIVLKKK